MKRLAVLLLSLSACSGAEPTTKDAGKTNEAAPAQPQTPTDSAKLDSAKTEPAKTEPAKTEPAKTEPAKTEPAKIEPAKTEPAKTEPSKAAAPAIAKTQTPSTATPTPAPDALTEVLFVSNPPGANVVLVDGSRTIPIGPTPVKASIDPSKKYEAVFALEGHKTRITRLDPDRDRKLSVDLRSGKTKVSKAAEPAKVEPPKAIAKVEPPSISKAVAKTEPPKPAKIEPPKAKSSSSDSKRKRLADVTFDDPKKKAASDVGQGTLAINTRPPCEILIDGRATGLTTPQREMTLPGGMHKVTLVNGDLGIRRTMMVKINPGKLTKVSQDLSADAK